MNLKVVALVLGPTLLSAIVSPVPAYAVSECDHRNPFLPHQCDEVSETGIEVIVMGKGEKGEYCKFEMQVTKVTENPPPENPKGDVTFTIEGTVTDKVQEKKDYCGKIDIVIGGDTTILISESPGKSPSK